MMTREKFAQFLEPYLFQVYEQTIEQGDDLVTRLYNVNTSEKAEEKVAGIGNLGLMQKWNGSVYYDTPNPLWDKVYRHEKYSIGIMIERDLWEDAQYPEIKSRINAATLSVHRTRQLHATSVFNNAFDINFPGPDGRPLCDTQHPLYPGATEVQSNAGTSELSIDNIEATRIAMMNFTDDRGKKLLIQPDTILVSPSLQMRVEEFLKSDGRADTDKRADNVRKNAYNVIVLPLLENSNNWFMVDSKLMKQYLMWFERRKPIPERDEDFDTETLKWKYVCRYSFGFHGWQWIYGHNVA